MGFSLVGSQLKSRVLVETSRESLVKFGYAHQEKQSLSFSNSSKCSRLPQLGKLLVFNHEAVDFEQRTSPKEVKKEMEKCYKLIQNLGRGVVYLGSSRMGPDHPHYDKTVELGKQIAILLDCTSWTGAGPGLMDAALKGALQAGKSVGGFKIGREAGEWTTTNIHPHLPSETYLTCRFFSARKHGLIDAAVRNTISDRTAIVALPGGIGTLDEIFEILTLIQLQRIGSDLPVPFLVMNYDSYYSKLFAFLDDCEKWGAVSNREVSSLWKIFDRNSDALEYLAEFYNLPHSKRKHEAGMGTHNGTVS